MSIATETEQEQSQQAPLGVATFEDFDVVPIPMPALAHPAGELVHPWSD